MKTIFLLFLLASVQVQAKLIKDDPSKAFGVADADAITGTAVTNDGWTSAYRVDQQSAGEAPRINVAAGQAVGGLSGWWWPSLLWSTVWNINSGAYTDGTITAVVAIQVAGAFDDRIHLVMRGAGTSTSGQPNSAYALAFYPGTGYDLIETDASAAPSSIQSGATCAACSAPFTIKFIATGSTLMGSINGTPIPTVTDTTYASGYYGFTTLADNVSITAATFDDGKVTSRGPSKTKDKSKAMFQVKPTPVRLGSLP